jgi:MFS family permease
MRSFLTRIVITLSVVSLLTDISSEMLIPVMPAYLTSIGFTVLWIGILEGVAEAVVGLTKGYFGKWSDVSGRRMPFVVVGYLLSTVSKPVIGLLTSIPVIFLARSGDRLGKGIRTAARDAILAHESGESHRGKVFGFHRAADTFGAALGPLIALAWLHFNPGEYRQLFIYAFFPSLLAVGLLFLIKEKKPEFVSTEKISLRNFFSYFSYWKKSSASYKHVATGLVAFAVVNSSDAFLLLRARDAGATDEQVILAYVFYNLIYALFAFPAGAIADRIGMKKSFMVGLLFFIATYFGMAFASSAWAVFGLFVLYGIYAAIAETVSRAWLSGLCEKNKRATALGFYSGMTSLAALAASTMAGLLWLKAGAMAVFLFSAAGATGVFLYFVAVKDKN